MRVQAGACCQSYQSVRVGQPIGEEAAGPPFAFKGFLQLFGTEDGAKRGTLDAMSRRKLGSRPQHLSAIQGKPSGAAMCGYLSLSGTACDWETHSLALV